MYKEMGLTFSESTTSPRPTTTSSIGFVTPAEPSAEEQRQAEYQEATLDCMQMERNIKMIAKSDNLSFEESLLKLDLKPWWEQAKARFQTAKEALALPQHVECVAV